MQTFKNIIVITLAYLTVLASSPLHANQTSATTNVLMIAVDDLNTEVGAWGGKAITPHLDKLANEGVQFLNAYTVVPACNPSRVAIMTGLRPETTGQYGNPGNFRDNPGGKNIITMGQFFQENGYQSVAAGKIFHKQRGLNKTPLAQSDPISWTHQIKTDTGTPGAKNYLDSNGYAKWLKGKSSFDGVEMSDYLRKFGIWGPISENIEQTGDWKTANHCNQFMQEKQAKPFFLACGIFRPHSPQLAPEEFFELYPYAEIALPLDPVDDVADLPKISKTNFASSFAKAVINDKEQWTKAVQAYLASVSFADATIGHILSGLENSEYKDNTVVVLWSDHGWQVGQKHRWEKFSLWKQATHSPFIIKAPGIKAAKVSSVVSLLDVFPTLVNLTGLNTNLPLQGHDLTPLLEQPNINWPYPAVVTFEEGNHSIVFENFNFIHYKDGSLELYNHANDPLERNNLAGNPKYQDIIDKYRLWLPTKSNKAGL